MSAAWLEELNPAQREAVTFGDGPLLVVAGAGTGKTKTLACRVAYLVEQGVPAERILLLTFTRRAAAEMLSRAGYLIGDGAVGQVWGGTFHSLANRLLRIYGQAIDLATDFTVMDVSDAADLMNLLRAELGLSKNNRRFARKQTLVKIYSHTVNAQKPLEEVLKTHFPWCKDDLDGIREIFTGYTQRKREQNVLDFDDLLLFWRTLCSTSGAGEAVANRFDHILVDEYQDTNAMQSEILRAMRRDSENLMVVGDDAQSIYSFRAATIRNILDFPKQFPGARQVTLEQNYRSTQPILAASNAVMEPARERYTKNLWSERRSEQKPTLITCFDEAEQCEIVCRNILAHFEEGVLLMNQAVLFRAGHHSAQLEVELARRNIPFHKYGGLKFVEAAHIKDLISVLRILENPRDEISWYRVLQLIEGIGPRTARRIMGELSVRAINRGDVNPQERGGTIVSPLARLVSDPPSVPPAARENFAKLREVLAECRGLSLKKAPSEAVADESTDARQPPLASQLELIRHFYEPIFKETYENPAMRLRDIEQLQQIAARYRSRGQFITDLTLDPPNATSDLAGEPDLDEDYLILSTIHSAKGLEFKAVYILHAADGMIPSDMAVGDEAGIEEERRLFYVAMTRAKDRLYIFFPLRYYHHRFGHSDAHNYAQLTRYIPKAIRPLFEERSGDAESDRGGEKTTPTGQVDAFLNDLWNK